MEYKRHKKVKIKFSFSGNYVHVCLNPTNFELSKSKGKLDDVNSLVWWRNWRFLKNKQIFHFSYRKKFNLPYWIRKRK